MSRARLFLAAGGFACLVAVASALPTHARGPRGPASSPLAARGLTGSKAVGAGLELTKSVFQQQGSPSGSYTIVVRAQDVSLSGTQVLLRDVTQVGSGGTFSFTTFSTTRGSCMSPTASPDGIVIDCTIPLDNGEVATITIGENCEATSSGFRVTNSASAGPNNALSPSVMASAVLTNCFTQPLAAVMLRFSARGGKRKVVLSWRTGTELDVLGFNVWRFGGVRARRVNRSLIAAKGAHGVRGASYRFVDRSVRPKVPYRYKLEIVELDGTRVGYRSGTVRARRVLPARRPARAHPARHTRRRAA